MHHFSYFWVKSAKGGCQNFSPKSEVNLFLEKSFSHLFYRITTREKQIILETFFFLFCVLEQVWEEQMEVQEQLNLSVWFYTKRISMFVHYRFWGWTLWQW